MATLTSCAGTPLPEGATAELDHNYPVTVIAVRAPEEEDDPGSVTIRYEWGATDEVGPERLNAYIDID